MVVTVPLGQLSMGGMVNPNVLLNVYYQKHRMSGPVACGVINHFRLLSNMRKDCQCTVGLASFRTRR
jgi:hypothetical protein